MLTDVINDDAVIMHLQYSTQWDSLAHVGQLFDANGDGVAEPVYYNGYRPGDHVRGRAIRRTPARIENVPAKSTSHAHALGVENMAVKCVQGRGVMIDLHAHVGRAHAVIGYDQLMRILDADKVVVETGDMVCLHTGFSADAAGDEQATRRAHAGKLLRGARWTRPKAAAMDHRQRTGLR